MECVSVCECACGGGLEVEDELLRPYRIVRIVTPSM